VHFNAGFSRSPTLVWRDLVLGGMLPAEAGRRIITANPRACPGDPAIMDEGLLAKIRALRVETS